MRKEKEIIRVRGTESCWNYKENDSTVIGIQYNYKSDEDTCIPTISMDKFEGPDLNIDEFERVLVTDVRFIDAVKNYSSYKRIHSMSIEFSDESEVVLYLSKNINTDIVWNHGKPQAKLRVSHFNKVSLNQINNIWVGDLVELLKVIHPVFEHKLNLAIAAFNTFSEEEIKSERENFNVFTITDNAKEQYTKSFYPKYRNICESKLKGMKIEDVRKYFKYDVDIENFCDPCFNGKYRFEKVEERRQRDSSASAIRRKLENNVHYTEALNTINNFKSQYNKYDATEQNLASIQNIAIKVKELEKSTNIDCIKDLYENYFNELAALYNYLREFYNIMKVIN